LEGLTYPFEPARIASITKSEIHLAVHHQDGPLRDAAAREPQRRRPSRVHRHDIARHRFETLVCASRAIADDGDLSGV
jgi:hypothetical protein